MKSCTFNFWKRRIDIFVFRRFFSSFNVNCKSVARRIWFRRLWNYSRGFYNYLIIFLMNGKERNENVWKSNYFKTIWKKINIFVFVFLSLTLRTYVCLVYSQQKVRFEQNCSTSRYNNNVLKNQSESCYEIGKKTQAHKKTKMEWTLHVSILPLWILGRWIRTRSQNFLWTPQFSPSLGEMREILEISVSVKAILIYGILNKTIMFSRISSRLVWISL